MRERSPSSAGRSRAWTSRRTCSDARAKRASTPSARTQPPFPSTTPPSTQRSRSSRTATSTISPQLSAKSLGCCRPRRAVCLHRRPPLLRRPTLVLRSGCRRSTTARRLATGGRGITRSAPGISPEGLRAEIRRHPTPARRFLQCFLDAGFRFEHIEEPAGRDYPYMLALRLQDDRRRNRDDLLQGEELAYVGTDAARPATDRADSGGHCTRRRPRRPPPSPLDSVYHHQAEAWEAASAASTSSSRPGRRSGKTLAFNLPVLDALAREPKQRALYLYPTKALAQDQAARARQRSGCQALRPAIYDGDTETERRWQIRKWANVILTNPDMLHVGSPPPPRPLGRRLPEPPLRRSSTRRTCTAASSARTWPTSCAGCAARRVLRRRAAVPARIGHDREPGRAGRSLLGVDGDRRRGDAAPRAERTVAFWNPPLMTRSSACGRAPWARPRA